MQGLSSRGQAQQLEFAGGASGLQTQLTNTLGVDVLMEMDFGDRL